MDDKVNDPTLRDRLGRKRLPSQNAALERCNAERRRAKRGLDSLLHRVAASSEVHDWFKELSPRERGVLLEKLFEQQSES